ncbi:MAG: right-handed parallel beta-helix repeat-containing protein [Planctomycetota bacterium]|nr:right-handed parallel beta-helix repeat-containing protein [Planctomycetota bacterium]
MKQIIFHVSPQGDDNHSGSWRKPFATLTRARDAARQAGPGQQGKIVVRGGDYYEVCLQLGPEDSGLTIEAAEGESPGLYGGRVIRNWEKEDHFYAAELPGVKERKWDFRLLAVNGAPRARARLPEWGRFQHESEFNVRPRATAEGLWERPPTEQECQSMRYRAGDLGSWLDPNNAEVNLIYIWDEAMVGVEAVDERSRTITFSSPAHHPPGAWGREDYIIWNVREGMHEPGQWYLDRSEGKVVYWPLPGEDLDRSSVIAPTTERVIALAGTEDRPVRDVRLAGLELSITTTPLASGGWAAGRYAGAIDAAFAHDCQLDELTVASVGGQAIRLQDCDRARVAGCETRCTGAGGIYCLGGGEAVISQNLVHQTGEIFPSGIGIRIVGLGHQIRHNEIHDTSYSAIEGGSSGARIESNLIYDFMKVLDDGAAIYNSHNGVCNPCREVTIRGNVVRGASGKVASAYYLDELSVDCTVEENLAVNTMWPSHNHLSRNCTIRQNVFLDEGESKLTFPRCESFVFEKNVVCAGKGILFRTPPEGIASMPGNVLFSSSGKVVLETTDRHAAKDRSPLEVRDGTVIADPLFMDAEGGDYRFVPASPAQGMGIHPIDTSKAGRNS